MTNEELKQIRLSMNLLQKDLAKLLHVNPMTISRWECGYWPMPEDKAELLRYKQDDTQWLKDNIQRAIDSARKT